MHGPSWLSWTSSWRPTGGALVLIALLVGIGVFRLANGIALQAHRRLVPMLVLTIINLSALILVWAIADLSDAGQPAVMALTSIPPVLYLLPTVILFGLTFLKPFRSLLSLNIAALACGLFGLMGFRFSLAAPAPTAAEPAVSVMSYDVDHWTGGAGAVADAIRASAPDIVCLQDAGDSSGANGPGKLEDRLSGYRFVRSGELMIGSTHTIGSHNERALPGSSRSTLEASVSVHGRDLHVVDVHLTPDKAEVGKHPAVSTSATRIAEANAIDDAAKHWPGATVVCEDTSDQPLSGPSRTLTRNLSDAFDAAGWGFGYTAPSKLPVTRPDQILVGPGIKVHGISTANVAGSNHLPVVAQISIIPPPRSLGPPPPMPAPRDQKSSPKPVAPVKQEAVRHEGKDD